MVFSLQLDAAGIAFRFPKAKTCLKDLTLLRQVAGNIGASFTCIIT